MVKLSHFPKAYTLQNFAIFLIPSIVLLIISFIPSFISFSNCTSSGAKTCEVNFSIANTLSIQAILPILGIFWLKYFKAVSWRDLGIFLPKKRELRFYLIMGIVWIALLQFLSTYFGSVIPGLNEKQYGTESLTPLYAIMALVAPFVEEVAFRGFEFSVIGRKYGFIVGTLLSSLTFGIFHAQLNVAIFSFLFGLYLCYLVAKSGSLVPGIILHFINNSVGLVLIALDGKL